MTKIRGYIAASVDGYIADADGGVGWLREFEQFDYGYDQFIAEIGTVVIGRATYDQVMRDHGWPYHGKRAVILSNRPVDLPPNGMIFRGPVEELVEELRQRDDGDVWVVGGATVQQAFLDAGALDLLELYIIPRLLGRGIPLWPESSRTWALALQSAERLAGGTVRLIYGFDQSEATVDAG